MSYPSYTTEELSKIQELSITRFKNLNTWKEMFGFFFWDLSKEQLFELSSRNKFIKFCLAEKSI